jgi:hypothetical protein
LTGAWHWEGGRQAVTDDELKAIREQFLYPSEPWEELGQAAPKIVLSLLAEVERLRGENARLSERMDVVLHAGPSTSIAASVFDRAKRLEDRVAELEGALLGLGDDVRARYEFDQARVAELQAKSTWLKGAIRRMAEDLDDHAFEARRQAKDTDPSGHWGILDNLISYLVGHLSEEMREATNEGFRPSGDGKEGASRTGS